MDWTLFCLFFLACIGAGATGAIFSPGAWYAALRKPSWTPPDWLFPVAWTILYVCIAAAGARAAPRDDSGIAMALFAVQIAFNTLWTPVFFGRNKIAGGLAVLTVLWLAVAGTLWAFVRLDTISGLLFVPYLAWVTVAYALNFEVWRLNRGGTADA